MDVQSNPSNGSSRPFLATDFTHSFCCHRAHPMHSSFLCPHILAFFGWCLVAAFHAHPIGSSLHPLCCGKYLAPPARTLVRGLPKDSFFPSIRSTPYHISMLLICKRCRNMLHSIRGLYPGCCIDGVRMTYG
ncbi:hypothetical protein COCSADRAFT_253307 [Bipolaris sorokiniana ND90Pr]|uniref:Uncharacterized protein n=1 Tax=Cochliobolus sativus (strain ND90Pr / ATCC 201652) TaxID=665912 RepID=M2SB65_COCSN|nr:uncharacterized protein COCSADRAFT_253307 [Bipolaris sorokiniana ND90Pr]EMD59730.1 hypothetical protein COCSADRAFT_253307 [Bipolaris sorokiniana ND90Pr]